MEESLETTDLSMPCLSPAAEFPQSPSSLGPETTNPPRGDSAAFSAGSSALFNNSQVASYLMETFKSFLTSSFPGAQPFLPNCTAPFSSDVCQTVADKSTTPFSASPSPPMRSGLGNKERRRTAALSSARNVTKAPPRLVSHALGAPPTSNGADAEDRLPVSEAPREFSSSAVFSRTGINRAPVFSASSLPSHHHNAPLRDNVACVIAAADSPGRFRPRQRGFSFSPADRRRRFRSRSPLERSSSNQREDFHEQRFHSPTRSFSPCLSNVSADSPFSQDVFPAQQSASWQDTIQLAARMVPEEFFPPLPQPEIERLTSIGRPKPFLHRPCALPHSKFLRSEALALNEANFQGQKSAASGFMTRSSGKSHLCGPFFKTSGPHLAPIRYYEGHNQLVAREPSTLDSDFGDWGEVLKHPVPLEVDLKREETFLRASVRASSTNQVFSEGAFECLRSLSNAVPPETQLLVDNAINLMEAASEARCHSLSATMRCLGNVLLYRREAFIQSIRGLEPFVAKAVRQLPLFPDAQGRKNTALFGDCLESLVDPLYERYKWKPRPAVSRSYFSRGASFIPARSSDVLPSQATRTSFGNSVNGGFSRTKSHGSLSSLQGARSFLPNKNSQNSTFFRDANVRRSGQSLSSFTKKFGRGRGGRP